MIFSLECLRKNQLEQFSFGMIKHGLITQTLFLFHYRSRYQQELIQVLEYQIILITCYLMLIILEKRLLKKLGRILRNLTISPLGIESDGEFRISLAGAQEKTALHQKDGKWFMPKGAMPTTHILKPQIGKLGNGIDLSQSVENEYFCLKFLELFDIPINNPRIYDFDDMRALVVERFDRRFTSDNRLIRLPQEDFCQALSVPSTLKYQNQGGPGVVDVLKLLNAGDRAVEDKRLFLKVQILFWLISATDGHAKNFSIYLLPSGRYHLTPIYDVLSTQPMMDKGELQAKEMKLAMSVGNSNHYKLSEITGRHFVQSAEKSGIVNAQNLVSEIIDDISYIANAKLMGFCDEISDVVPVNIIKPIVTIFEKRLKTLL